MADIRQVGNNIKCLREQKGLTQKALADKLMVSFQAISAWERGISIPDLENTARLADFFGVPVDTLLSESAPELFVGIDGGGTKTEFVLFTREGSVLATQRQSGSNPNDNGIDASIRVLSTGLELLLQGRAPRAIFAGIGGGSSLEYQKAISSQLSERFHCAVTVNSDAANVLSMGIDPDHSAAVICGTGSCVFVRKDGCMHRLGGWGYLLDQAGSAYDVGKDALRLALSAEDGLVDPDPLTDRIFAALNGKIFANISQIYQKGRPYIADMALQVLDAAKDGVPSALNILEENAARLGLLIRTAITRYGTPPQIVGAGGFLQSELFRSMVEQQAGMTLDLPTLPPVYGACVEALRAEGIPIDPEFRNNFTNHYRRTLC